MKLNRLLSLLVACCLMLSTTIFLLQFFQNSVQEKARRQLDFIMTVQSSIDILRSRLWLLQRHNDNTALLESQKANVVLRNILQNSEFLVDSPKQIVNLLYMQDSVERLLELSEKNLNLVMNTLMISPQSMLSGRLNMLLLSMSEEVFSLHQSVVQRVNRIQQQLTFGVGLVLVLLSLCVTALMLLFRHRFKGGLQVLTEGIRSVKQGSLEGGVKAKYDDELRIIADELSHMKITLNDTMISRDALQLEVENQTRQLREQHQILAKQANTDSLTGVLNRRAFDMQVQGAIARTMRVGRNAALLYMDLNDFKLINDNYGHEVGDIMLNEVADRLSLTVRETDLVARLGGDEFVVWLDLIELDQNIEVAISRIGKCIEKPIEINGVTIAIKMSIGVSLCPSHSEELSVLLRMADEAMYQAKLNKNSDNSNVHICYASDMQPDE